MSNDANLKVKIGADIAEIKSALTELRGSIKKTQTEANGFDFKGLKGGLSTLLAGIGGFGAITLGINAIVTATIEAEKAQAQLNAVLKSTGGAAGLSATELNKMADGLQAITTYDDEAITGAQALLLTFTNIGRDVFPQATKAILNMSTALGQDLGASTTLVGKALNDPIKGLTALTRVGVSFSNQQKELIKDLVDTGRVADAQREILKELERQYGGSAEAARNTLGGALQGLKNDFNNLLEGDTGGGGVRGTIDAINDLAEVLKSQDAKQGFADFTNMVFLLGQAAAVTTGQMAKLFRQASEGLNAAAGSGIYAYSEATLKEMIDERERLLKVDVGASPAKREYFERQIAELKARLQELRAEQITASINEPPPAPGAQAAPQVNKSAESEADAKRKAAADAAERKRIADKEAADLKAREDRIKKGMFDVNNAILTSTGDAAQAAFNEIDAKYAQLLADLRAKGGQDGEIIKVEQIINLEKAEAQLSVYKNKLSQIADELRAEESRIADQVTAGSISQLEAERRINDARDVALGKMKQLQAVTMAYIQSLDPNSPEGQKALEFYRQLGIEIDKTRQQQNTMAQEAKDIAENAFAGLFEDLILGAKSAKDAFQDFVKAFVQGVARMIAERLAQIVVERLFNAILGVNGQAAMASGGAVGGFVLHSGGVVGSGGMLRNVDPALFANAPRYHSGGIAGLRPGEVPAILERGELVIPKNAVGKGGGNVSVIVENNSGAQARTEESMVGSDKVIRVIIDAARNAVANDIARGGTTLNKAMEGRYGVNPQGVTRG